MITALALWIATAQEPAGDAFDAAWQREYAWLAAERASLADRVATARAETESARSRGARELDALQARLVQLQTQREAAEAALGEAERSAAAVDEAGDALRTTWIQVRSDLDRPGFTLADPVGDDLAAWATAWDGAFVAAADRLIELGQIREEQGAFFDVEGVEVSGSLLRVGEIATFGVGPSGAAALVPVGDGNLRATTSLDGATADALRAGAPTDTMKLFLHEGRQRRVEEYHDRSWSETRELGGTVGDAILILGAAALALILARIAGLLLASRGARGVDHALAHVAAGRLEDARRVLAATSGSAARVLAHILPHAHKGRAALEDVAREALLTEQPRIERFGTTIVVFSTVAPLVGLLGTVSGIITTFEAITRFGNSDPKLLSGGISEALIATEFGLGVAIPSLLVGHLLLGWGHTVLARAENGALRLINALEDAELDDAPAAPRTLKAGA